MWTLKNDAFYQLFKTNTKFILRWSTLNFSIWEKNRFKNFIESLLDIEFIARNNTILGEFIEV